MMELNLLCLFRKLLSNVFLACLRDLGKPVTLLIKKGQNMKNIHSG